MSGLHNFCLKSLWNLITIKKQQKNQPERKDECQNCHQTVKISQLFLSPSSPPPPCKQLLSDTDLSNKLPVTWIHYTGRLDTYPVLAKLARKYLASPATTVPCVCSFSANSIGKINNLVVTETITSHINVILNTAFVTELNDPVRIECVIVIIIITWHVGQREQSNSSTNLGP